MKRPLGVTILMVLLGVTALVCLATGVKVVSAASGLEVLGAALGGLMFLLAGLVLATAIGMSTGEKWGWWLGTVGYAISAVVNGVNLITIAIMSQQNSAVGSLYTKHGLRGFFALLIVAYLFQGHVLRFFGLQDWGKGKLFGVLAGVTLGCCVVLAIIGGVVQVLMFGVAGE